MSTATLENTQQRVAGRRSWIVRRRNANLAEVLHTQGEEKARQVAAGYKSDDTKKGFNSRYIVG